MIGAVVAGLLAVICGAVLATGLVTVIRLMARISGALTSIRILTEAVVHATDDVNEYVQSIGTNVNGILEEATAIGAFVHALPSNAAPDNDPLMPALNAAGPTPQELT